MAVRWIRWLILIRRLVDEGEDGFTGVPGIRSLFWFLVPEIRALFGVSGIWAF